MSLENVYAMIDSKMKQIVEQLAARNSQQELRNQEKNILVGKLEAANKEITLIDAEINTRIKDLVKRRKTYQDEANTLNDQILDLEDEGPVATPKKVKRVKKRKRKAETSNN